MIELEGKFNTAKVFTDVVDQASISQVIALLNQPFVEGSKIRMMPDIHAGAGCTIGTTMTIKDAIVPNLVGVDIGCGMEVVVLKEKRLELQKLDKVFHERVPTGFEKRKTEHRYARDVDLEKLRCAKHVKIAEARLSLGTLGGGNHFGEANKDEEGTIYIVIHSGSRHLGLEVANYYQEEAYKQLKGTDKATLEEMSRSIIEKYKAEGREKELSGALKELKAGHDTKIPKMLAYCSGYLFDDYLHDMEIVQYFAERNRQAMMDEVVKGMGVHVVDSFTTIHNYIDTAAMILRKGSVSAADGERLIIPINMRDGSLICTGKGNEDWNYSAPHGAGRLMSRSEAKETLTVSQFKKEMEGIYSTTVSKSTLDEAPMAYKSMEDIVSNIGDTVSVEKVIKPIYNFKAGDVD